MKDPTQEGKEKMNEIMADMEKKNKEKYNNTLLIVKCLNDLEKLLVKKEELYSPLILTEKDQYNSFNLVKIQVDYYWQKVKKGSKINHSKEIFLETFESLFLGKSNFNYDRIQEKITFFDMCLQTSPSDAKEKYIDKVSKNKKDWSAIIECLCSSSFQQIGLLFCGLLDFSSEKIILFRFLVNYCKIHFKLTVDLNTQEINKVEDKAISGFFDNLLSNEQNDYIKIVINDGNLDIKNQSPDELILSFNEEGEEEDPDLSGKNSVERIIKDVKDRIKTKKSKTRKKRKNAKVMIDDKNKDKKKEENKEEEKKQEFKKNSNSNNPQKPDKNEIPPITSDEEKKKAIKEEAGNVNKKSLEERIRILEERNIEMEKRNTELEHAIYFLTNKNRNFKNKHNSLRKKVKDTETKLSRVEDTVNLIQARDAIKAFIDFFYFGLKFKELVCYEERIKKIIGRLNSKKSIKKIDTKLLSEINYLLNSCSGKLKLGNNYAHKFDITKDAFAKLFSEVDPDKNCPNIRIKFEKEKAYNIIFKLLDIRENFYFNKVKLNEEEKALYDDMPSKLDSTLY